MDPDHTLDLCRFCYPSEQESILYENDSVYVIPSLGHFVEGYLLIISKEHETCVADAVDSSFILAKKEISKILESEYGSACFFEHGRIGSCYERSHNRICYHAHLHCLPVANDFTDEIAADHGSPRRIKTISELEDLQRTAPHYLYVEPANGTGVFFNISDQLERQYLRKKACEAIDLPTEEANWKENPNREAMKRTVSSVRELLRNHNTLSSH